MVLQISYLKGEEVLKQDLNIISYGRANLITNLETLKSNLKEINSITDACVFDAENKENYSLLENIRLINEVLLLLNSLYREFSLVIKQDDDGKKIIVHYSFGSYKYTEINCGDKTFSSYLEIKESIEFAEKVFNDEIM